MRALEAIMAALLVAMVVMVFGNVVLRYAFESGITESEELSRWGFVWLTFIGAVVALKEHAHLGTDMVIGRLPPWARRVAALVSIALMLWMTWLVLRGSWAQVLINKDVDAPVTGWSMGIVYLAGVAFAVPAIAMLLRDGWRVLRMRGDASLDLTQDTEDHVMLPGAGHGAADGRAAEASRDATGRDGGARR